MNNFILTLLLLYTTTLTSSIMAGTAHCSFEHTSRYQSDLIPQEIDGYICKLDLDVKGSRVNEISGGHEGGERDTNVDIIKILPDFYSYLTTFPSTFCSRFTKLEIIDVCRAEIATIEADSLNKCKDLRIMQFYMNKFEQVPENLFAENKKLLKIYITFNSNLKSLPDNLFLGLVELKLLDLSYNRIDHLSGNIFDDLTNLKELNLEANSLPELEIGLFEKLGNLETLNLNNIGIAELPAGVFGYLGNLKTLHLKSNKLTIIHADSFPQQANIDTVVLSKNKINAIDEYFIDTCEVKTIKMGGNVCDKTSTIKEKDIKKKLEKCFANYEDAYPSTNDRPMTPKPVIITTASTTTTTLGKLRPTTTTRRTTTTPSSKTKVQKLEPLYSPCGIAKAPVQNIVGGSEVIKGTHPWIAALIHKTSGYFCGGILYTKRLVVTAAHCINNKQSEKQASDISVHLGVHKLDNLSEIGRKSFTVESIHVHNQWNSYSGKFDADIAILKLSEDVTFGTWIQPVCIAKFNAPLKNFNNGIISGFGKFDKSGKHSNIPIKANTPIRSSDDCYDEFPALNKIASHRTFCGGFANGTGACTGDSGGGLTVVEDDVHYLRGIVSASLHGTEYGCDVESYSIFTDIKYFIALLKNP